MGNLWKSASRFRGVGPIIGTAILLGVFVVVPAADAGLITSDSTSNSITINWTAPGDDGDFGTASFYDIRYSTLNITEANWGSATQVSGEPVPHTAGTPESFIVTGLSPSTTYYFAIKSGDEIPNWSAISNVASGVTAPESIPPRNITNLATSNPTGNSITLTWTAPGDDSSSGTASQYDIRYSTSPITDANWASATQVNGEPTPLPAGQQQTFAVTGLQSGVTYYFAMKTADEVPNWSGLSNVASGTTADITPPSAIDDLDADAGFEIAPPALPLRHEILMT
ncbi:MAG: hypothetical protein A2W25_17395 [candidate division Zixibacteria bacterium RBG_16_53_22]|nr:MAG: hypothetical protein A2W25_17395 [candidate division Zixibacteria bacterium RBG_16_53_22]